MQNVKHNTKSARVAADLRNVRTISFTDKQYVCFNLDLTEKLISTQLNFLNCFAQLQFLFPSKFKRSKLLAIRSNKIKVSLPWSCQRLNKTSYSLPQRWRFNQVVWRLYHRVWNCWANTHQKQCDQDESTNWPLITSKFKQSNLRTHRYNKLLAAYSEIEIILSIMWND